ncbi:hypothetical protein SteCoe_14304 [Stentor coeruleus]|uniref:Uncharacterized protein n=1 Tax=Stentor coeruleus TaxID=5963 RepID=A0A1R2C6A9_9CILI|nr:hypothetical protein SteCoe_14304 [Stentor coeruleus]
MDEKLYTESMKLRSLQEVMDKLEESGTMDIIQETLKAIQTAVPPSKNQIQLLCSMLIDEVWKNKLKKKRESKPSSMIINDDYFKSYTARSSVQLSTARSTERIIHKSMYSTNKINEDVVSEFSQGKGSSFSRAPREPPLNRNAPGPGTYEPTAYTKDRTPRMVFGNSKRPDHFTKKVCGQMYNPVHFVASKPYAR